MLKVPATETFGGRTTLLSGISHRGLNRNENNSQQDFELLIDQLMPLRRGEDNKCYLLILIENAIERASGMTLANDLQVLLEQWDKIIETIQFDEGQLVGVHRDTIMMDRKDEIRLYRQILNRQVSKRVLLIKGGPKMGKSQLMREFRRIAQQERQFPCALVDIRTRGQSYRDVLKLIVQEVGYSYFRRYEEKAGQLSSRSATPAVPQGDLATMIALFAASQSQAAQSSGDQRDQLTQAFLEDLRLMPPASPVILLLDAFEEANEETRLWIYRELIIGLYRLPNVLTVVAGRELPEPESTWQEASITTELTRVTVEDYKAYCSDMGATELTEDNIQLFYRGFDGRPGDFAEVVQNFIPRGVK
jgi:hypothetical protein